MFTPRPPSSSSGNATVPDNAPIQPPQAFVDCDLLSALAGPINNTIIDWSYKGIIGVMSTQIVDNLDVLSGANYANGLKMSLAGNAITNTDAILPIPVNNTNNNGYLDLSGGTNAEPTWNQVMAGGNTSGANVTQLNGKPEYGVDGDDLHCFYNGAKWVITGGVNGEATAGDEDFPWLAAWPELESSVTRANSNITTLVSNGWTVTVNIGGVPTTFTP